MSDFIRQPWFVWGLVLLWQVSGWVAASHAIMYKRDPRSAAIWMLLSFLLPFFGPWMYLVLGINRMERKAVRRLGRRVRPFDASIPDPAEASYQTIDDAVGPLVHLRAVADHVSRLPLLPGNRLTPLHNGEQVYPRMLEAISEAKRSITLISYIFDWDEVGRSFADALETAAARGVKVHLLVDGIGALGHHSRMGRRLLNRGVELAAFFPLRFPLGRLRFNLRNHRKIMVVDGRVGFTGGVNISARHLLKRRLAHNVEDLHFELHGLVVAELQHSFVEDWALATGKSLSGDDYFPALPVAGPAVCRGMSSGPDEEFETIHLIVQAALHAAEKRVHIVTPYFIPTSPLISAMSLAALRGVEIRLFLPAKVDLPFMRWAADAYLWQLLEHGIQVYRRPPPFVHSKLMVVDNRWLSMGSANMDRRSFRLNFEFNVEAYDVGLATELTHWLDGLVPSCHAVTLAEMDGRPRWRRFRDGAVRLLSPHL